MTALRLDQLDGYPKHDLPRHPAPRLGSLGIAYDPGREAVLDGRGRERSPAVPAHVRLTGALGGVVNCNPERLRYEAARLLDAADTLDAILAPPPPITGTLFDPEVAHA